MTPRSCPNRVCAIAESGTAEVSRRIRALAEAGDWAQIEAIALRWREEVPGIPESDRRAVVLALQEVTAAICARARSAREETGGRLSALRRGRAATEAYNPR